MAAEEKYPKYINGVAVYSKDEKNSFCHICPDRLVVLSEEHLKNVNHLSIFDYYIHSFTDYGPYARCKLCSYLIEYSSIIEHAVEHKSIPWYKPNEESKIFFTNLISTINDEYYCHICCVKLSSWYHAISHTEEVNHQASRNNQINVDNVKVISFSISYYKYAINNAIFMGKFEKLNCALCSNSIDTLIGNICDHISSKCHSANEIKFLETLKTSSTHIPPIINDINIDNYSNEFDESCGNNVNDDEFSRDDMKKRIIRYNGEITIDKIEKINFQKNLNDKNIENKTEKCQWGKLKEGFDWILTLPVHIILIFLWILSKLPSSSLFLQFFQYCGAFVVGPRENIHEENVRRPSLQETPAQYDKSRHALLFLRRRDHNSDLSVTTATLRPFGHSVGCRKGKQPEKYKIIKDPSGKLRIKRYTRENEVVITDFPEEIIYISGDKSECTLCKCKISTIKTIMDHVDAASHKKKLEKMKNHGSNESVDTCLMNEEEPKNSADSRRLSEDIGSVIKKNLEPIGNNVELSNLAVCDAVNSSEECDVKMDESKELIRDPEKVIDSPGKRVCLTNCDICFHKILGDSQSISEHKNSEKHREAFEYYSLLNGRMKTIEREPKLNTNDLTKYFVVDKQSECDSVTRVMEIPGGKTRDCGIYFYWCNVCNIKFYNDFVPEEHLKSELHLRNYQSQFEGAKLFSANPETLTHHLDCTVKLPESAERFLNAVDKEIEVILKDLMFCRSIDRIKEAQLLHDLREIAVKNYPNAVAYPFGSRITGLGGKNSDLDVFLDCPTENNCMYFGTNFNPKLVETRLEKIKECLENNGNIWHIDKEILKCRIPIIKTKHKPTDIECDLSFTNGLAVENTSLIKNYCDKSLNCRKLIIFIKNWMNHCGACGINSYGIAWLVIYFLQTKRILPTVHQLIEMKNKSQIIGGWETGVSNDFQAHTFGESFRELLNQFFKFYGNFDYRNDVICPLLGRVVKKIDFRHRDKLPYAMWPYTNYIYNSIKPDHFRVDSIMCLQDPFDLAYNITKSVSGFKIYKFKTFCCSSAKILDGNI